MSSFVSAVHVAVAVLETGGFLYSASVASATAMSLFASAPDRRRDARDTLRVLVWHRPRGPKSPAH
jgi:hypothetical protein